MGVETARRTVRQAYVTPEEDVSGMGSDVSKRAAAGQKAPVLSIIIPTYNRCDVLQRVLKTLASQTGVPPDRLEVAVVDDASTDGTKDFLERFAERSPYSFRFASLEKNSGPARARNAAIEMSSGRIVLMLGDDIVPAPDLLERHLSWHREHPEPEGVLLGYVTWPEAVQPTAFMRWLEQGGRRFFFNYADASENQPLPSLFFYTCNISLKRRFLEKTRLFDETFPFASHEDLELGKRLSQKGMRLVYDGNAVGYHWHFLTVEGICRRVYLMGYSAHLYWEKVEETDPVWKKNLRFLLVSLCSKPFSIALWKRLRTKNYWTDQIYPLHWRMLLHLSFFLGMADSHKGKRPRIFT